MPDPKGREPLARPLSRAQQRQETRERVYQSALAEFDRVGVADTQIERIVQLAGVSVGTFYRYFPGKDAVLLELQQRLARDIILTFKSKSRRAQSLRDLLHLFAESVLAEPTGVPLGLQREAVALVVRTRWPEPDWTEHPMFGLLTQAIAKAQEAGEIRSDIEPRRLMHLVSTSVFGFAAGLVVPSAERITDARQLIDLILQSLAAQRAD